MKDPYYLAYEKRYQAAYLAGAERWGHSPDDDVLYQTLKEWVNENNLQGKSIVEYACGEGACGVVLSRLGCRYHGVDIAPSAIAKSREALEQYPNATVEALDMVKERVTGSYDAALDCMGLHMLITDDDRMRYLQNACSSLKKNAPMLFFRESYRRDGVQDGAVHSIQEWIQMTGNDYETPQVRQVRSAKDGITAEVLLPLLPARARDEKGYREEFEKCGFVVEKWVEMDVSTAIPHSASFYTRKADNQNANAND